ncbi:MAG: hypothetical protein U0931_06360 [Vulcanimicrobiota bacterium]
MSSFTHLPKSTRYLLAALTGLGLLALLPSPPARLRTPMLDIRGEYARAMNSASSNMRNQFTPGFKKRSPWPGQSNLVWSQGQIFRTGVATNLAVDGQGCFRLEAEGRLAYTRDGRFDFCEGVLATREGWTLQAVPLDELGNIAGEPGPLKLELEPLTHLYDGRFTGYHFDRAGKFWGELSGGGVVPLYQVLLYQFPNPAGLAEVACRGQNIWLESKESGQPQAGVTGQGTLGWLCPSSLELSNVDFMSDGANLKWLGDHSRTFTPEPAPSQLGQELRGRLRSDSRLRQAALENLANQLSPGYRSWDVLGYLQTGRMRLRLGRTQMLPTANSLDVALIGDAYLVLEGGEITRNGHFVWSPQGLRCGRPDGPLVLGYPAGGANLEPIRLPSGASSLEISCLGEVLWTALAGDGQQVRGYRLALALPTDPQALRRSGLHLRPECECRYGVAGPGFGTSLEQGKLETSDLDAYEERLLAPALLELAGLPAFELR